LRCTKAPLLSAVGTGADIWAIPRIASGEQARSKLHDCGQNESVPWQHGAIT
jgi:hypothetical protein